MAAKMTNVALGTVTAKNGGSTFGLLADAFSNVSGKSSGKGNFSIKPVAKGTLFKDNDFVVTAL